jgi:pyrroloquinoline quinone (PQQ) biosynthesis protein C
MLKEIESIYQVASQFPWENRTFYAEWLAQSFFYVSWTTRQLALASAYTKPGIEDQYHWRFVEEAREEKKHEVLCLEDLKALGHSISEYQEYPHTSFFYQTLNYMIERIHPVAILGYSLTLEGFAAEKAGELYERVKKHHGPAASHFLRLHCELDKDHFANALPYLKACPEELLPIVEQGARQCGAIYRGILADICQNAQQRETLPKADIHI